MIETPDDWYFSPEYQVMVWIAKVTSLLSIAGSICIIVNYFQDPSKRQKQFNSIVLYMSFVDIVLSLMHFAGTWMLPKGFAYLAEGTTTTCSLQGFLFVFTAGTSMLYGTMLSITFVLVVIYRWSENDLRKWRVLLLYFPIAANLIFAIIPLTGQLYNPLRTWGCYIATYPRGCGDDCERGNERMILPLKIIITTVQLLYFIVMIACMVRLYLAVLRQEKKMKMYSFVRRASTRISKSIRLSSVNISKRKNRSSSIGQGGAAREVAIQGLKYTCVWFITFVWFYAIVFTEIRKDSPPAPAWLYIIHSIFSPMQGFFNFFVYYKRSPSRRLPAFCLRGKRNDTSDTRLTVGADRRVPSDFTTNAPNDTKSGEASAFWTDAIVQQTETPVVELNDTDAPVAVTTEAPVVQIEAPVSYLRIDHTGCINKRDRQFLGEHTGQLHEVNIFHQAEQREEDSDDESSSQNSSQKS